MNKSATKHILFLVSTMGGGGAERVAAILCNAWVKRGYRVTLMPTFSGRGSCAYPLDPKVNLIFLADLVDGVTGHIQRLWALRKFIVSTNPDIVVSFLTTVNIAALLATFALKTPVVVSEHNHPPNSEAKLSFRVRFLRRKIYRWARAVVVLSLKSQEWCLEFCSGAQCRVIENPVILPLPSSQPIKNPNDWIKPDRKVVISCGRLVPIKRVDIQLRAFACLAIENPDWDLVILGKGPEYSKLNALRDELKLNGRVHFPGFVGNLQDWYIRANIYVMTSAYEGFPNTLLEAMAHGVPSVAFDVLTGPCEIMNNGELGVLLPDDDHVGRLKTELSKLMSDSVRRQQLSDVATKVRDRFSEERILAKWDELFESLR